jgi:hypothetical protein
VCKRTSLPGEGRVPLPDSKPRNATQAQTSNASAAAPAIVALVVVFQRRITTPTVVDAPVPAEPACATGLPTLLTSHSSGSCRATAAAGIAPGSASPERADLYSPASGGGNGGAVVVVVHGGGWYAGGDKRAVREVDICSDLARRCADTSASASTMCSPQARRHRHLVHLVFPAPAGARVAAEPARLPARGTDTCGKKKRFAACTAVQREPQKVRRTRSRCPMKTP